MTHPTQTAPDLITAPINPREVAARTDEDGRFTGTVTVNLATVSPAGIAAFERLLSRRVTGDLDAFDDLTYRILTLPEGTDAATAQASGASTVRVQVAGDVSWWLDEHLCATDDCIEDAGDGEGFDGYCGNCADRLDAAGHWD